MNFLLGMQWFVCEMQWLYNLQAKRFAFVDRSRQTCSFIHLCAFYGQIAAVYWFDRRIFFYLVKLDGICDLCCLWWRNTITWRFEYVVTFDLIWGLEVFYLSFLIPKLSLSSNLFGYDLNFVWWQLCVVSYAAGSSKDSVFVANQIRCDHNHQLLNNNFPSFLDHFIKASFHKFVVFSSISIAFPCDSFTDPMMCSASERLTHNILAEWYTLCTKRWFQKPLWNLRFETCAFVLIVAIDSF